MLFYFQKKCRKTNLNWEPVPPLFKYTYFIQHNSSENPNTGKWNCMCEHFRKPPHLKVMWFLKENKKRHEILYTQVL